MEVLPSQAVLCLQLVEPRGEPLGAPSHCAVRLMAFRHSVLHLGGPASSPLARLRPLLLGDPLREACKRPWEGHGSRLDAVRIAQPFHPAGVWLLCHNLCPFVILFVAGDSPVGWAPLDLDDDAWPGSPQRSNVLFGLERVLLAGAVRPKPSV